MADEKEKTVPESATEVARGYTKIYLSPLKLMRNNFLGGLAWGFGTVLGATIVVALVLIILGKLNTVPYIGDFIGRILEQIEFRNAVR